MKKKNREFDIKNYELRILKADETAFILGMETATLRNRLYLKHNPLPIKPIRVGRSIRFKGADVKKYIDTISS